MRNINIKRKRTGVPILSRDEMDEIGEILISDFHPDAMIHPQEIDIDLFAQDYLNMDQDFKYLSHCGLYLGMTVFNDTDRVIVFNPEVNQAEYLSVRAGTIIIDSSLLSENKEHLYRFTMGHEVGHGFLHTEYFCYNPDQLSPFDSPSAPMIQCRAITSPSKKRNFETDQDWMEWQANCMASAILMPRSMVHQVASEIEQRYGAADPIRLLSQMTSAVANTFNVSREAAFYRIKGLLRPAV